MGLITQSWGGWAGDVAKGTAIGAVLAGAGGALLVVACAASAARWWAPAAAVVVGFGVVTTYAGPVVLDPLFNSSRRCPPARRAATCSSSPARPAWTSARSTRWTRRSARRPPTPTSPGIGHTKRVVLYDTLLRDFSPAEVRLVVAHELGHVRHRDVPHGLLWLALVAPFGDVRGGAARRAARRRATRRDRRRRARRRARRWRSSCPPSPSSPTSSHAAVEARADAYSLELTDEPEPFDRLPAPDRASRTSSDPDPPRVAHCLLGTHPTTMERIGAALAFEKR